jgi:hypothetical protein
MSHDQEGESSLHLNDFVKTLVTLDCLGLYDEDDDERDDIKKTLSLSLETSFRSQ